jgi:uncharacterized damage-inducible protein DinB
MAQMNPYISDLAKSFARDLDTLSREITLYPDDASLWAERPGLPNTGGNLTLHLVGNVRHFIGVTIGGSSYVRDRDHEFAARQGSRGELVALIAAAKPEVASALAKLPESKLDEPFPLAVGGVTLPTRMFLLHLATHFTFHLGQIDYHRRIVTGNPQSAGTLPVNALV